MEGGDEMFRDLLEDSSLERGPIFNDDNTSESSKGNSILKYYDEEIYESDPSKKEEESERRDIIALGEFKLLSECSHPHSHYVSDPTDGTISLSSSSASLSTSLSSSYSTTSIATDIFMTFGNHTTTHSKTTSLTKPKVRQCWYSFSNDVKSNGEVTIKHEETLSERINRLQLESFQLENDLKREIMQNEICKTVKTEKVNSQNGNNNNNTKNDVITHELRVQSTCLEVIRDIDRRVARIEGFIGSANYEARGDSLSAIKGLSECAKRLRGLNSVLEQAAVTGEEDEVSRNISVTSDVVRGFEESNGLSSEYARHVAALYGNLQRWEATVKALPEVFEKFRGVVKMNLSRIDMASFDADLGKIENTQKVIESEIKMNSELLARIAVLVAQSQKEIDESLTALENKIFKN